MSGHLGTALLSGQLLLAIEPGPERKAGHSHGRLARSHSDPGRRIPPRTRHQTRKPSHRGSSHLPRLLSHCPRTGVPARRLTSGLRPCAVATTRRPSRRGFPVMLTRPPHPSVGPRRPWCSQRAPSLPARGRGGRARAQDVPSRHWCSALMPRGAAGDENGEGLWLQLSEGQNGVEARAGGVGDRESRWTC